MPRPIWSGSLSFGLVNVPVQLVSGVRDLDYHFHQLHATDHVRIEQRRFCSAEDEEVPWEEIGHGYELDGRQVVLTDDELGAAEPRKTRTIDIESFVDLADVDPIHFDHPYFLVPAGESEGTLRAYRLLVETMGEHGRVALGRFVMRTREHLAAVRERDGVLGLTTMRFADEVRDPGAVPTGGRKPAKRAVERAVAIIEELSTDWDPGSYRDCYRERLERVVADKRRGRTIEAPEEERQPAPAPDLMAALEETLEAIRSGEDPRSGGDGGGDELGRMSRADLYERAQREGVEGRSKMGRDELAAALRGD